MASIYSSDLHGNENASITFSAAILGAVWKVRSSIPHLAHSRKADEYAPGAIHALRKLCEGEGEKVCGHIHRQEVEEWRSTFRAWFDLVKRLFPAKLAKKFLANAEDDFQAILACSVQMPESFWRNSVDERHIQITFKNDNALEAARSAAEEKHPVKLGSALHKYIQSCIDTLVGNMPPAPNTATETEDAQPAVFAPRVTRQDGSWLLYLDQFDCFDSSQDLEQDIVTTAYDIEDAVRNYVSVNHPAAAKALRYNSESSLCCMRASNLAALSTLLKALLLLATDHQLLAQYRVRRKNKKKGPKKR